MRAGFVTALATAAIALAGASAQAVTVSTSTTLLGPGGDVLAPTSTTGDVRLNFVGNDLDGISPNSRSPWDATAFVDDPEAKYHSVSGSVPGSSLTYAFGADLTSFSLMWGSPDDYNKLEFFDDGLSVFSITGDQVDEPPPAGTSFVNVIISDIVFDTAVFTSGNTDAFEFARVQNVPVPAALPLFGTALLGIGLLAKRRRKAA